MAFDHSELGELAEVIDSLHKTPSYSDSGIPMVRVTDVKYGKLNLSGALRVDRNVFEEFSRRYSPRKNDTIITRVGSYGISGLVDDTHFCLGQNTAAISPTNINPIFLYYALNSPMIKSQIEAGVVGSTQKTLSLKVIKGLKIPRFGGATEQGIAKLLSSLDSRIALLRDTNTTLEAIAQALFKSWFVDFDPVRAKAEDRDPEGVSPEVADLFPSEFVDSDLGAIPKGWRSGTLADFADLNPESWTNKVHPTTLLYVDLANTKDNQIEAVTEYQFEEAPSRARRVLRSGDTIVGTVRPGNRSFAFVLHPPSTLTGSTGFAVLRPLRPSGGEFVFIAATRTESIDRLAHLADGGAYPAVRHELVQSLPIVIPQGSVLDAFHQIVAPIYGRVAENELEKKLLGDLRDTLLPRLMSGKLRIPDFDEVNS